MRGQILLTLVSRYPPIMYTPQGKEAQHRLWAETLQELAPYGVADILKHLKN